MIVGGARILRRGPVDPERAAGRGDIVDGWGGGGRSVPVDRQAPGFQRALILGRAVGEAQRPGPGRVLAQVPGGAEAEAAVQREQPLEQDEFQGEGDSQRRDGAGRGGQRDLEIPEGGVVEGGVDLHELDELHLRSDGDSCSRP